MHALADRHLHCYLSHRPKLSIVHPSLFASTPKAVSRRTTKSFSTSSPGLRVGSFLRQSLNRYPKPVPQNNHISFSQSPSEKEYHLAIYILLGPINREPHLNHSHSLDSPPCHQHDPSNSPDQRPPSTSTVLQAPHQCSCPWPSPSSARRDIESAKQCGSHRSHLPGRRFPISPIKVSNQYAFSKIPTQLSPQLTQQCT